MIVEPPGHQDGYGDHRAEAVGESGNSCAYREKREVGRKRIYQKGQSSEGGCKGTADPYVEEVVVFSDKKHADEGHDQSHGYERGSLCVGQSEFVPDIGHVYGEGV